MAASTTYTYTVRAKDAAGNLSDPSSAVTPTTPAWSTFTLSPDADAQVRAGTPTTNYGTTNLRSVGGATAVIESFLRFTVGGVTGSVQSAKLRLFNYNGTADGPAAYSTGNSWVESTINWNTRPLRTSGATDDKGAVATNSWVEYNVTPLVTGNGTYSFTVAGPSTDGVDFRRAKMPRSGPSWS